jgi:hypothetical protein
LRELIESGREQIDWESVACILTVARFCAQRSELEVAERWYADRALEDLLVCCYPLNCLAKDGQAHRSYRFGARLPKQPKVSEQFEESA